MKDGIIAFAILTLLGSVGWIIYLFINIKEPKGSDLFMLLLLGVAVMSIKVIVRATKKHN